MTITEKTSNKEITDLYYKLVAGGPRVKLLESMVTLGLPELLYQTPNMAEADIITKLGINAFRGKKWLYLLSESGYLKHDKEQDTYSLGPITELLVGENDNRWWFFKQMLYSWLTVANQDITAMLKGREVDMDINWPPKTDLDTTSLEEWMRRTAQAPIKILDSYVDFTKINHLLDIGGGDGTMATTFAGMYPNLNVSIYNLKKACELANHNIVKAGVENQVQTIEGDFFEDTKFPKGHDTILFSRVLCDWPEEVCLRLLKMSYKALPSGGQLIICEPFRESNKAFSLVWEYRYLFWDNFGKGVFKRYKTYVKMLKSVGFEPISYTDPDDRGVYQVLIARK